MNCCFLGEGDGDGPKFSVTNYHKARKPRQCGECGEMIVRGERYEHVSGKWDEHFDQYFTCLACVDVREAFGCNGWTFEQVWEDIETSELFNTLTANGCIVTGGAREDGDGDCLAGLSPRGRAKLHEQYMKWYCEGGHESREAWQLHEERADCLTEWLRDCGPLAIAVAYAPPWAPITAPEPDGFSIRTRT